MTDDLRIMVLPAGRGVSHHTGGATAYVVGAGAVVAGMAAGGAAVERLGPSVPGHAAACVCCTPRAALVDALHRLFIRRARGDVPFFRRVIASASEVDIAAALADPLVASRFRAEGGAVRPTTPRVAFRCD